MASQLVIYSANHHSVQLSEREKLSLAEDKELLGQLTHLPNVSGFVSLETCNRIELVVSVAAERDLGRLEEKLKEIFSSRGKNFSRFSRLVGDAAIRHLFRVVSGLDSQVLGEAQIAGQMKKAYYTALHGKRTDTYLNRAFHRAFFVSKRIRTESQIGRGSVSIASLATKLCEQIVGDISQRRVLVLGAGEMAELTLKHLAQMGLRELSVINRTAEKSFELAKKFGGKSFSWERMADEIERADVIISTVQGQSRIRREDFPSRAPTEAKCVIDLSFPRSVHPSVEALDGIYLYTLEDLKLLSERNLGERLESGKIANQLVEEEVARFLEDDSHDELGEFSQWVNLEIAKEESRLRRSLLKKGLSSDVLLAVTPEFTQSIRSLASKLLHEKRREIRTKRRGE